MWISGNQLGGSIPPQLGNLAILNTLNLNGNGLSGAIPRELGNLASLRSLGLYTNQLSGSIPPELGGLTNLEELSLEGNQLSGPIPTGLGSLAKLRSITLHGNQLSGSIPPELGGLTSLETIILERNQLSGPIPPELGSLAKLRIISLSSNHLSGSIPPGLGSLANLQYLTLSFNQLSGSIPPQLGNLLKLNICTLASNQLIGDMPSTLMNLTNLYNTTGFSIGYNGLYATDSSLKAFITLKGGNWEATQTIAPTGLATTTLSSDSIQVSWTPILYKSDSGGYRIYSRPTSGGGYILAGTTADKYVGSYTVTGLNPGTTYYFAIKTVTYPHYDNQNTVESEYSLEVSGTTWSIATQIEKLITDIQGSLIDAEIKNSLKVKLENALDSLKKGNKIAAMNKIEAFQNEVQAQSGKKIPVNLANEWLDITNHILDSLRKS
jgi:hypothetical protein